QVDQNRLVRSEELGQYFVARPCRPVDRSKILQIRPERLPDGWRQDAFEVLERGALQVSIVGMQAPERNLKRLVRQDEREQREDVCGALAGPIADVAVGERHALPHVDFLEESAALPHPAAGPRLA